MGLLLLLLAVVPAPQNRKDDATETRFHRVHLHNGNFIDGDLLRQTAFEVDLRVPTGTMTIQRDLIDRVEWIKMRRVQEAPTPVAAPTAPPPPAVEPVRTLPVRSASTLPVRAAARPQVPSPLVRAQVDALLARLQLAAPEGVDGILREIAEVEGDTTSYVAALMETGPIRIGERLGPVLVLRPDPAAIPYLLRLFSHGSALIRAQAAAGVGAAGARSQLPDLAGLAKDPSPMVRTAAVEALQEARTEEAFEVLLAFTLDPDREVRTRALLGLSLMAGELQRGEQLPDLLLAQLERSTMEGRTDLLRAIGQLRNPAPATRIAGHLNANAAEEREAAARALGELGNAETADAVVARMATEGSEAVQLALATAATRLRAREGIPFLIEWLGSPNEAVKKAAVSALKDFSGKDFKGDVEQWTAWWEQVKP